MERERPDFLEESELKQPQRPPQADESSIDEADLDDDFDVDDLDDDDIIDDEDGEEVGA
jgi:hypothetical protein